MCVAESQMAAWTGVCTQVGYMLVYLCTWDVLFEVTIAEYVQYNIVLYDMSFTHSHEVLDTFY